MSDVAEFLPLLTLNGLGHALELAEEDDFELVAIRN